MAKFRKRGKSLEIKFESRGESTGFLRAAGFKNIPVLQDNRATQPVNVADGAKAATLSGLYNCQVCGQEKCAEPGICDDCLAPPTEFELKQEWQE
jgi:hypothetical protein